jgi:hypothetical protein
MQFCLLEANLAKVPVALANDGNVDESACFVQ